MASMNNSELKQREHNNWASAADGWRRRDALLTKGAAPVTRRMLELSKIVQGSHLLDIASGTGEPSISAARIVGESGKVTGTDLVEKMLTVAREKAAAEGLVNIEYHCMDAEEMKLQGASFDAVTIRWGLMFMPEPEACLITAHNALKNDGRICLACWAAPEDNPFVGVLMQVLSRYMEVPKPLPDVPGIFSFSNPQRIHHVLEKSGFKNIEIEELIIDVIEVENGRAYWEAMSDLAAPVMALVNKLDDSIRENYINDVIDLAETYKQGDSLPMKGTTWIAYADK
jgi:enediyne biosynthesis protein CalE5